MSGISTGIGLASGLDIGGLVNAIIGAQQAPALRLQARAQGFAAVQSGLKGLEAFVLGIKTSVQSLGDESTVTGLRTDYGGSQFGVITENDAVPGVHSFRTVRLASSHSTISSGFANTDTQKVGAGTLVFSPGGEVATSTRLDLLNGGTGIERGSIRITDRDGNTADIDLSTAYDVDDLLDAINTNETVNVTARAVGDRFELVDSSAGAGTFSVANVGGRSTATDLGLVASTATNTITGSSVFSLTEDFTLDLLNDGNGLRTIDGADDLRITLTDDSVIDVDLDGAASLADVVAAINDDTDNGGKLLAEFAGEGLRLTDQSGGGGSAAFAVTGINTSNSASVLGLEGTAVGGVITGDRLLAGLNSVLVRNLRGGEGIDVPGSITIDDRAGNADTIDLSAADSLDEIVETINANATVQVRARLNDVGNGIVVEDLSGGGGNLTIADVATGTTAANLGIAVDAAVDSVDSGSLGRRYVNEATTLADYLPPGVALQSSTFSITDSSGAAATVVLDSTTTTIGDVIQRINQASGISVTAELNDTGDGLVIIDDAGGAGTLSVDAGTGNGVEILGLSSNVYTGSDSRQRISGSAATTVTIEADDTLDDVVTKINAAGGHVTASLVDSGSAINPFRLRIDSKSSGRAGRFLVEDGIGLNFSEFGTGRDALLRVGTDAEPGFLRASSTNFFADVATGMDLTLTQVGENAETVSLVRDGARLESGLSSFVSAYNAFIDNVSAQTRFDSETGQTGPLNGQAAVVRISSRLESIATRQLTGLTGEVRSLNDLGIRTTTGGKLVFDSDRFQDVLAASPDAVADFFLTAEDGFGAVAESTLDALTDSFTGTFKLEDNALQSNIDSLVNRIADLNAILEVRRERLLLQFVRMEETISLLQSQQQAIGGIRQLSVAPARTGVSSS